MLVLWEFLCCTLKMRVCSFTVLLAPEKEIAVVCPDSTTLAEPLIFDHRLEMVGCFVEPWS